MQIAPVMSFFAFHLLILSLIPVLQTEVAVSLNSNDVQIFSRQGNDWKPTETLSEVRRSPVLSTLLHILTVPRIA
jgi:hypothetical protein